MSEVRSWTDPGPPPVEVVAASDYRDALGRIERLREIYRREREAQVFTTAFDLITHIERQREFSERTFGPGLRTEGVSDHIRKELLEIAAAPRDLSEWVDVILLALDGAWRAGYTPMEICEAIGHKQRKNEMRKWPDWRMAPLGKAIEHDRTGVETTRDD